jgi:membrane protein
MRTFGRLLLLTAEKCQRDHTPMLAAGLSFYTMLSLAPALWIIVAAAGAIVGRESARAAVLGWTERNIGPAAPQYLGAVIDQVNEAGTLATLGGAIAMVLGATAAFSALHDSLNRIWHQSAPESPGVVASIRAFVRNFFTKRALAFLLMLLLGVLLLISLLASSALAFIGAHLPARLPAPNLLLQAADFAVSVLLMLLLFSAIYHLLHNQEFPPRALWAGAALTAVLFAAGKTLISLYLGSRALRSAYGAAGSLVLLLLWVYYSAQILFFGAEFTEILARRWSARTKP